jgi:hypothetical protein
MTSEYEIWTHYGIPHISIWDWATGWSLHCVCADFLVDSKHACIALSHHFGSCEQTTRLQKHRNRHCIFSCTLALSPPPPPNNLRRPTTSHPKPLPPLPTQTALFYTSRCAGETHVADPLPALRCPQRPDRTHRRRVLLRVLPCPRDVRASLNGSIAHRLDVLG